VGAKHAILSGSATDDASLALIGRGNYVVLSRPPQKPNFNDRFMTSLKLLTRR